VSVVRGLTVVMGLVTRRCARFSDGCRESSRLVLLQFDPCLSGRKASLRRAIAGIRGSTRLRPQEGAVGQCRTKSVITSTNGADDPDVGAVTELQHVPQVLLNVIACH
jgi:hypothetical protein